MATFDDIILRIIFFITYYISIVSKKQWQIIIKWLKILFLKL